LRSRVEKETGIQGEVQCSGNNFEMGIGAGLRRETWIQGEEQD